MDWGGGALDTKAKCEAANLRVYVFVTASGGREFVDAASTRGVWTPAVTFPPGANCGGAPCINVPASCALGINIDRPRDNVSGRFNLEPDNDYKFALSARDYTNPNAPVFKKIKLSSARRQQVL